MIRSDFAAARVLRAACHAILVAGAALLTGCAAHYVDGNLKEVSAAEFMRPAQPKPVQLIFDFQTKGVTNARATDQIKPMVAESIRNTGLFAELKDVPGQGAGLLSVTLNNVPIGDDAAAKGFMAGLTFGAAGQQVTDGYICTVSYLAPGQGSPVVKTARHAIHTTIGAKGSPGNSYPAKSIDDAVGTMVRQIVGSALNDLSRDAGFR